MKSQELKFLESDDLVVLLSFLWLYVEKYGMCVSAAQNGLHREVYLG